MLLAVLQNMWSFKAFLMSKTLSSLPFRTSTFCSTKCRQANFRPLGVRVPAWPLFRRLLSARKVALASRVALVQLLSDVTIGTIDAIRKIDTWTVDLHDSARIRRLQELLV